MGDGGWIKRPIDTGHVGHDQRECGEVRGSRFVVEREGGDRCVHDAPNDHAQTYAPKNAAIMARPLTM